MSKVWMYSVAGLKAGIVALLMTVVCSGILGLSIILFMYVPGEGVDWLIVIVSVVSIVIGEVAIRYAEHERTRKKA